MPAVQNFAQTVAAAQQRIDGITPFTFEEIAFQMVIASISFGA